MYKMNEYTNIITMDDPIAQYCIILDANNIEIDLIRSYNIDTKEAEI